MSDSALEIDVVVEEPTPISPKEVRPRVDAFRFDLMVDTDKINEGKLANDVKKAMIEITGDQGWRCSVESPGNMDVEDHSYDNYEAGDIEARCLQVYNDDRPELSSSLCLSVREACLAGIARADDSSVWTNGVGDLFYDADPYGCTWQEVTLHNSVVIDTGSEIKVANAKKMVQLKFTINMPDDSGVTEWSGVHKAISAMLKPIGWQSVDVNYSQSDKFGGNMYKWHIQMARTDGTKPAVDTAEIAKVWEACLSGVHAYRLAHEDAVILTHKGRGSMQLGDQRWEIIKPPGTLFVEGG